MIIGGTYVVLLVGLLVADLAYLATSSGSEPVQLPAVLAWARPIVQLVRPVLSVLAQPEIQYSVVLTLLSCLATAVLSLIVAVPIGYILARFRFRGHGVVDAVLDIPVVLPPLVVGLSLLVLFQFWPFRLFGEWVFFAIPGVVLAQFTVAAAFAVRIMRATFDQIDPRPEQVALTLGCTHAQAFGYVTLPQAAGGMITAGTLAWARALGEFGPLLIFVGTMRFRTEVLSMSVFLEMSIGNLEAAVAISMLMIGCAIAVLFIARMWGTRTFSL